MDMLDELQALRFDVARLETENKQLRSDLENSVQTIMFGGEQSKYKELIEEWRHRYTKRFEDAKHEKDEFGVRLIFAQAHAYLNCTLELEKINDGRKV